MRPYIQYVESRRSEADKGISLNANWNYKVAKSQRTSNVGIPAEAGFQIIYRI